MSIESISIKYMAATGDLCSVEVSLTDLPKVVEIVCVRPNTASGRVRAIKEIREVLHCGLYQAVRIHEFISRMYPLFKNGIFISMIKGNK